MMTLHLPSPSERQRGLLPTCVRINPVLGKSLGEDPSALGHKTELNTPKQSSNSQLASATVGQNSDSSDTDSSREKISGAVETGGDLSKLFRLLQGGAGAVIQKHLTWKCRLKLGLPIQGGEPRPLVGQIQLQHILPEK